MVLGNHDNTGYVGGDGAGSRGMFQYTPILAANCQPLEHADRYYQHSAGTTTSGVSAVDSRWIPTHCGGFADPDIAYAYHTYGIDQRTGR